MIKKTTTTHDEGIAERRGEDTRNQISPSMGFQERLKIFEEFRTAKNKILSPEDYTEVSIKDRRTGEVKKRKIILKSGWRKIKLFFGISSEIIELRREKDDDKIIYMCKAKVFTQSGMSAEAIGICSSDEPGKANMSEYVLSSIAQTRAINKAIADLVGADFDEEDDELAATEEDVAENISVRSRPPLPDRDRTEIISKIFDNLREIGDKVSRQEIFSRIKQLLGIDRSAQVRITELRTDELRKVLSFLEDEKEKIERKQKKEERFRHESSGDSKESKGDLSQKDEVYEENFF